MVEAVKVPVALDPNPFVGEKVVGDPDRLFSRRHVVNVGMRRANRSHVGI